MRPFSAAAIALFAAAACSPKLAPTPAPPRTDQPAAAATPAPNAAARLADLPDCLKVEAKDDGDNGWKHPDCRLHEEKSGLNFTVQYGAPALGKDGDKQTPLIIAVSPAGGAVLQTIAEKIGNTFAAPSLEDLNGDGFGELLIPLDTANVNTNYAIWGAPPGANQFIRLGEISAVNFGRTADGFITASSRSSANSWAVEYFQLKDAELTPIATVEVSAQGDPDHVTGLKCALSATSGLESLKIDAKTAQAKFCAYPVARDIFK